MGNLHRIITKEEFNEQWRAIHDRIFTDRIPPERPFRPSHWEMLVFPEMFRENETLFHAITPIAKQLGDRELVVFVWEILDESIPMVTMAWNYQALKEFERTVIQGGFETHLFGQSEKWGIYSSSQHFVTYVGGEPGFMDTVASALGGRSVIRKEFLEYATNWEIREGEVAQAAIKNMQAIVKSVGWDWPEEGSEETQHK